jgi:hypothetical protein
LWKTVVVYHYHWVTVYTRASYVSASIDYGCLLVGISVGHQAIPQSGNSSWTKLRCSTPALAYFPDLSAYIISSLLTMLLRDSIHAI